MSVTADFYIVFHDRSSLACDSAANLAGHRLWAVVYPTGVFLPGPGYSGEAAALEPLRCMDSFPDESYEALVLPCREGHMLDERWVPMLERLGLSVLHLINKAYLDNLLRKRGTMQPPRFTGQSDIKLRWDMIFVLPTELDGIVSDLLAAVQVAAMSRVAVLGPVPRPVADRLDQRFPIFERAGYATDLIDLECGTCNHALAADGTTNWADVLVRTGRRP